MSKKIIYAEWVTDFIKKNYFDIFDELQPADVKEIINKAPAVDAEPVRHRTWVIKTHDDGYGEYKLKHCPDCDKALPTEFDANYCYWCGAKMDGKEKE